MAQLIKKHRSKAAKLVGAALFVLLMFFNLQIATNPNNNGDIDLFGLKISLFTPSVYATAADCCQQRMGYICSTNHKDWVDYIPCK
ncbi:hypothetical protein ABRY23_06005 [Melioribacteraceae bacterium 4301-Me]|uniref:hypothetical protein n=1 Tax=Pyranulibacter aquaticus TaxID=3163344 RepID=UPI00359BE430